MPRTRLQAAVLFAAVCWSVDAAPQVAPLLPGRHFLEAWINGAREQTFGAGVDNMLNDEGLKVSVIGATWGGIGNAWTFGGPHPRAESIARGRAEAVPLHFEGLFAGVVGEVRVHSLLAYHSRIVELDAPPYAIPADSLPLRLPVSVSYYGEATATASGPGSGAWGSARAIIAGFEVASVYADEICPIVGSCDGTASHISTGALDLSLVAGQETGVILASWANSVAQAGHMTGVGSARARAYMDPVFSFNQGAFDAMALAAGFPTFDLSRHYAFEFSEGVLPGPVLTPVPEPESLLLLAAGLALLTCRAGACGLALRKARPWRAPS